MVLGFGLKSQPTCARPLTVSVLAARGDGLATVDLSTLGHGTLQVTQICTLASEVRTYAPSPDCAWRSQVGALGSDVRTCGQALAYSVQSGLDPWLKF